MDQSRKIARTSVTLIRLASVAAKTAPLKGALRGRRLPRGLRVPDRPGRQGRTRLPRPGQAGRRDREGGGRAVRQRPGRGPDRVEALGREGVGFFGTTFHYRVNRSVAGTPLRMGGQTYRTGLGMHSFCELLIPLGDKYSLLVATAGIDDAVRPNGDATITFFGDGRPLGKPIQVTGKNAPQPVRLKLNGVESLLIRVDFGQDGLDFADHVDLVAARLIK